MIFKIVHSQYNKGYWSFKKSGANKDKVIDIWGLSKPITLGSNENVKASPQILCQSIVIERFTSSLSICYWLAKVSANPNSQITNNLSSVQMFYHTVAAQNIFACTTQVYQPMLKC